MYLLSVKIVLYQKEEGYSDDYSNIKLGKISMGRQTQMLRHPLTSTGAVVGVIQSCDTQSTICAGNQWKALSLIKYTRVGNNECDSVNRASGIKLVCKF